MMKRLIFIILFFTSFGVSYGKDKITIKVAYLPTWEARDVAGRAFLSVVERFQELHSEIQLEAFVGLSGPWGGGPMDPLLAIAGGVAPDIMYVNFRNSGTYINQGFLYPLDEYVEKWKKEDPDEFNKAIYPAIWPVIKRKGPDGDEHIWSIPFGGTLVKGLVYRKDLFKQAGLDPEKPPRNWDEFYEYCKKLTNHEKGHYGFAVGSGTDCSYFYVDFLWSAGGDVLKEDEKGNWHAVFNSSEAVLALEFYRKLVRGKFVKDGKAYRGVIYRGNDYGQKWERGEIGMIVTYLNERSSGGSTNPSLYGIAPVPMGPTGIRGNELNSMMYGINVTIKDKRKRDAAWEYMKFINSKEARRISTKIFVESGWAKYVNPKYLREFGYEKYIKEIPKEWEEILDAALTSGKPEPYGKNTQLVYGEMDPACEAVALSDEVSAKEVLDKAVVHCEEKMLKNIPKDKLNKRRIRGGIILAIIVISFGFLFYKVFTSFTSMHKEAHPEGVKRKKKYIYAWLIMLPALIGVALWQYYPLLRGSVMAFQDYRLILGSVWVGIDNFVEVLYTPLFWKSLLNSIIYAILILGLGFPAPIILALLLHEVPKGKVLFRVIYYLPAVTTGVVIMLLWKGFFEPNPSGLFNKILAIFGISVQTWLNDPKLAMLCVVLPIVWASIGPGCIIYLAALKSIPEEIYDAADIDGTGILSKIRYIVLPYLKPLIIINFVGAFIGAFRSFDYIFAMTGGGPLYATHVLGLEVWYQAFMQQHFGYATAMAWMLGSLLVGFTVYQLRFLSKLQFKTTST